MEKFDFAAAQSVAFAEFCRLYPDRELQAWLSKHATAAGNQPVKGVWTIEFLVYPTPQLREGEYVGISAGRKVRMLDDPKSGQPQVILSSGDDARGEVVFSITLDANTREMRLGECADFAQFDFSRYGLVEWM
ncbi:hypothetical protein [Lysobacter enzymogenes]|uniref:hypothetical protein n=1 Tax=Lysobacter enzymogenes TaxID=69 RepID=UPI001A96CD5B|nr:hypothetical protein [Lysobacter enzymogenes]QQP98188.1 hypothetical protein JHW38_09430 [Lysobacter enzymogenes]